MLRLTLDTRHTHKLAEGLPGDVVVMPALAERFKPMLGEIE
jgi:hypothetical protein